MLRTCIVLGGGSEGIRLDGYDLVICADSGYSRIAASERRPDLLVGDMDSIEPQLLEKARMDGVKIITYPVDKDISDGEACLKIAIGSATSILVIEGTIGSRSDHLISTIQMLETIPPSIEAWLHIGKDRIRLLRGGERIDVVSPPPVISLIPVSGEAIVSTVGLKYDLRMRVLVRGSTLGIHNEPITRTPSIEVTEGALLVVLSSSL